MLAADGTPSPRVGPNTTPGSIDQNMLDVGDDIVYNILDAIGGLVMAIKQFDSLNNSNHKPRLQPPFPREPSIPRLAIDKMPGAVEITNSTQYTLHACTQTMGSPGPHYYL